jgi:hypothetical protein
MALDVSTLVVTAPAFTVTRVAALEAIELALTDAKDATLAETAFEVMVVTAATLAVTLLAVTFAVEKEDAKVRLLAVTLLAVTFAVENDDAKLRLLAVRLLAVTFADEKDDAKLRLLAVTLLAVTFAVENVDVLKVFALIVVAVTIPPGPVALMIGALTDAAITFWDEEAGLDIAVLYTNFFI